MNNSYVVLGEYGRLLQGYLDVFPREQLLVLFHEDLERDPAAVCERVFAFLGVDPDFNPPDLGRRYNEGASRRRFAWLDLTRLAARRRAIGDVERTLATGAALLAPAHPELVQARRLAALPLEPRPRRGCWPRPRSR